MPPTDVTQLETKLTLPRARALPAPRRRLHTGARAGAQLLGQKARHRAPPSVNPNPPPELFKPSTPRGSGPGPVTSRGLSTRSCPTRGPGAAAAGLGRAGRAGLGPAPHRLPRVPRPGPARSPVPRGGTVGSAARPSPRAQPPARSRVPSRRVPALALPRRHTTGRAGPGRAGPAPARTHIGSSNLASQDLRASTFSMIMMAPLLRPAPLYTAAAIPAARPGPARCHCSPRPLPPAEAYYRN